jgi:Protein kinase domain
MLCSDCGTRMTSLATHCPTCGRGMTDRSRVPDREQMPQPTDDDRTSLSGIPPPAAPAADIQGADVADNDDAATENIPLPTLNLAASSIDDATRTHRLLIEPDTAQSTPLDDADAPTDQEPEPAGTSANRVSRDSAMSRRTANASGPLEVGQAFGLRYHIISLLGMGGMGAVYQAWDAELGVSVALKVIRPEIVADAFAAGNIERRFKRELLLARQITHKNVVRIHDLGEIDGIKYITMPLVDGSDLATLLKRDHTAHPQSAADRSRRRRWTRLRASRWRRSL